MKRVLILLVTAIVVCGAGAAPEAVPAGTASSSVQDVPEFPDGLGTVQSLNVVQVKSQVTGR